MESWKDNKCSPGGCSLEEVMRCTRPGVVADVQVPENLYTKKELDDVVKGMDLVVESFTRRIGELKSQQDVYVKEAKRANDREIRQCLTFSKIFSELSDAYEAYQTLVHAREYLRHNCHSLPRQQAISILNNALIDMEG
jgi:hypothetical protein